eukprot:1144337-Pelagomonas_calceolata.AAC.6
MQSFLSSCTPGLAGLDVSARRNIISIVGASTAAVLAGMLPVFPAQAGQLSPLDANYKMVSEGAPKCGTAYTELARRRRKIPIEEFSDGLEGLNLSSAIPDFQQELSEKKDLQSWHANKAGNGDEPVVGDRVAVHYDVKFRIYRGLGMVEEAVGTASQLSCGAAIYA